MLKTKRNSNILFSLMAFLYLFLLLMLPDYTKRISIAIIIIVALYVFIKNQRLVINHQVVAWVLYVFFSLGSCIFSGVSLNTVLEFCAAIVIGLIFYLWESKNDDQTPQINALLAVAVISFIGCIAQLFFPNTLKAINMNHLSSEKYETFDVFYRSGYLAGFSFQTAVTGFYLSIFVGIIFSYLMLTKEKRKKSSTLLSIVLLAVSYVFLFFTGKRSFILITIVAALIILCIFYKKNIFKICGISALMFIGLGILLFNTEIGTAILERSSGESWSTGRTRIYEAMISNFFENPILGQGVGSSLNIVANVTNGHNIYLQILSESGIIGFFILVPVFIHDIYLSIKLLNYKLIHNESTYVVTACVFIELLFVGWGLSGNPLYDVYPLIVYMIVAGIVKNEIKQQHQRSASLIGNTALRRTT